MPNKKEIIICIINFIGISKYNVYDNYHIYAFLII